MTLKVVESTSKAILYSESGTKIKVEYSEIPDLIVKLDQAYKHFIEAQKAEN